MMSCARPLRPAALLLLTVLAAGCTRPPLPDSAAAAAEGPYPELVPAGRILVGSGETPRIDETSESDLAARAALLRRRAEALRAREFDT